jgi:peptidoglycan-associated lipoprotein
MRSGVATVSQISRLAIAGLLAIASSACGHDAPPPKTPAAAIVGQTTPTSAPTPKRSDQDVSLADDIRSACAIDDVDRAPKFDFDSSQLSSNDRDVLAQLAKCMTAGRLRGRAVALVGRADPRGETEYNMNLGEARAAASKTYLRQLGVASDRLHDTSRGALDAQGHDEGTWRNDRRVDVTLDR